MKSITEMLLSEIVEELDEYLIRPRSSYRDGKFEIIEYWNGPAVSGLFDNIRDAWVDCLQRIRKENEQCPTK